MKRLLFVPLLALSLAGCGTLSVLDSIGTGSVPTPAANTTIDDTALEAAWGTLNVALDAINLWIDAKPSVVGTPKAKRIADGIDAVSAALTAAETAVAAASTPGNYATAIVQHKIALAEAKAAMLQLRAAMRSQ